MSHELRTLVILAGDARGIDHTSTVPFNHKLDIEIIINEVQYVSKSFGLESFAYVRGENMEIDRFVSSHEAVDFAKNELIKELEK